MVSINADVRGLSQREAVERLERFGPNTVPRRKPRPILAFVSKFWGPVPWMLEASIVLELALHHLLQGAIIAALLIFNAVLSFRQESLAQTALDLLRQKLRVVARVQRDGTWQGVDAEQLVPGDVVYVRMGDFVPADIEVLDGAVVVDQSSLTGESIPVDRDRGHTVYSGATVVRGEATGLVTATGTSTYFGKTAELVADVKGRAQVSKVVYGVVRYLGVIDALLVAAIVGYAVFRHLSLLELAPFVLILLVTAVPVALPAAFTVATALAAVDLARSKVLVAKLSAIDSAAAMDVLCVDKTGTLTENHLSVSEVVPFPPEGESDVLGFAAFACDPSTRDPFDVAILSRASGKQPAGKRIAFTPFDPATKRSEALVQLNGATLKVTKGSPAVIFGNGPTDATVAQQLERLAANGNRVLAIATQRDAARTPIGLIAFSDPIRPEAKEVIQALRQRGVAVDMLTGDTLLTAQAVARALSIDRVEAGIYPQDKLTIVQELQRQDHTVGMTGDGVNDAPSLRQADVGIAVANATDVAKAAAGLVLTEPGLHGLPLTIDAGRRVYQRLLTWTLNKLVKALQAAVLLTLGFFATSGNLIMTPRLMVLMLFANDFVTLSLASDRVRASKLPDRWDMQLLATSILPLTAYWTLFSFAVFVVARQWLRFDLPALQTLTFLTLIFTGQATIYSVRERGPFWASRPGRWLLVSSVFDVAAVSLLAAFGWLMTPLPVTVILGLLVLVALFMLPADALKVFNLKHLHTKPPSSSDTTTPKPIPSV